MMMMMMEDPLIVLSHLIVLSDVLALHLIGWHRVFLFLRKGGDREAERNEGRQGNSKLVHRFPP
jgi:hypothetical protein